MQCIVLFRAVSLR